MAWASGTSVTPARRGGADLSADRQVFDMPDCGLRRRYRLRRLRTSAQTPSSSTPTEHGSGTQIVATSQSFT